MSSSSSFSSAHIISKWRANQCPRKKNSRRTAACVVVCMAYVLRERWYVCVYAAHTRAFCCFFFIFFIGFIKRSIVQLATREPEPYATQSHTFDIIFFFLLFIFSSFEHSNIVPWLRQHIYTSLTTINECVCVWENAGLGMQSRIIRAYAAVRFHTEPSLSLRTPLARMSRARNICTENAAYNTHDV